MFFCYWFSQIILDKGLSDEHAVIVVYISFCCSLNKRNVFTFKVVIQTTFAGRLNNQLRNINM